MKALNKTLFVLNLLLACVLVAVAGRRPPPLPRTAVPVAIRPKTGALPATKRSSDSTLESAGDWRRWITQLRAAGVPDPVISGLVLAGVDDRWARRSQQAEASYQEGETDADALSALGIQHDREREEELRAAIGDAAFKNFDLSNVVQNLPLNAVTVTPSETESLYEFEKKMERAAWDANEAKLTGQIDQVTCDGRLQKAKDERDQQIKELLGDQRFADMFPAAPPATEEPRHAVLPDLGQPADLTFDAVLYLQSQWNQKRSDAESRLREAKTRAADSEDELRKINNAWEMEFQRVLGTNTYDVVQRENDTSYKEMKRYAEQWSLDAPTRDYVYRTIQYYEKTKAEYEHQARAAEARGEDVDWDGVGKNIQQFGAEMQQSLNTRLGQELFDRLKYNNLLPFARKTAN